MSSLHLLFIQLISFFSLGLNVYLYTHMLELTKILKDKTIADKTLFEKLESKIALVPEKVLDNPVAAKIQIITQSDSILGYVYLGVSIVAAIAVLYFLYTTYMALYAFFFSTKGMLASLGSVYAGIFKVVNIVPDKFIEGVDMNGTTIRLEVTTRQIMGENREIIILSIKKANEAVFKIVENISSLIVENPIITAQTVEKMDTYVAALDAAKSLF